MTDKNTVDELADRIVEAVKTGIKDEIVNDDDKRGQEQKIIELDDEDIDSDLDGLILDPAELKRAEEESLKTQPTSTPKPKSSTVIDSDDDQEIEFIEYVQRDRTNTLNRKSLIYELTDLTLVSKKFHKRSVVEDKPDLSIALASDKGLTRDFIDDLIIKLTS